MTMPVNESKPKDLGILTLWQCREIRVTTPDWRLGGISKTKAGQAIGAASLYRQIGQI